MDEPLDELYFKWLYEQVASVRHKNPARTYWSLIRHLFTKEFFWSVPNDDNRVEDGRNLRYQFSNQLEISPDRDWMNLNCSMLEMLVALAGRLAFEDEGGAASWFWELMDNVDLHQCSDAVYNSDNPGIGEHVETVINNVIERTYLPNGQGGLFPLANPPKDQTKEELWYQMSHYLNERA